ncbi:MAG TPA: NAD(P)-dependent oxidoreductase, partial [Noviherbaspirillum sp.]
MKSPQTIGFIGVGVMGEPICRHLAQKSGVRVLVNDRSEEPLQRLAAFGAQAVSREQIAQQADVIFMSLPSGEVVEQVVLGEGGLLQSGHGGQIIVDLSTSAVSITRRIAAALAEAGMPFADAPVMRTRAAAEAGTLAVPVGADDEIFALIQPYIAMFAADVVHAGGIGAGQVVKILNNMVL